MSSRARTTRLFAAAALVLLATGLAPAHARADAPEPSAAERLDHGETLTYEQTIETDTHRYVGGVTYTVIEASLAEVDAMLQDVSAYRQLLPRTKQARLIGVNGPDFFVELRQGNAMMETSYTIRVRRDAGGRTFRFWLDPTKPHGIADAWGFFRVEPARETTPGVPRVLLSYGVLADVGPGIVRALFEERLRAVMLSVPELVRRYAVAHFRGRDHAS